MRYPSNHFNTNIPQINKVIFNYGIFRKIEYQKTHYFGEDEECWQWMGGPAMTIGDDVKVPEKLSHREMFDRIIAIEMLDVLGFGVKFE